MKEEMQIPWEELLKKEVLSQEEKQFLCTTLMTTESRMERLIMEYFTAQDYYAIWQHRIGEGRIGGKACGLLLARKLIKSKMKDAEIFLGSHQSYFAGADVFTEFLEENGCKELWEHDRTKKEFYKENEELREKILAGKFSDKIQKELFELLEDYKNTPLIVRSSSLLEDGFGNSFSGKYESVFCVNQGDKETCLEKLEEAIKQVYASTTNPSAIEYRKKRKLTHAEERMALLIQRVEGELCGDYYFPVAAGMGCSYNPYKWMENMNPDAGMMRLVMGLGTRAVERTPGDYPRLVCLDRAQANLRTSVAERHKFSQRQVDVLDFTTNKMATKFLDELIPLMPKHQKKIALSHDTEAEDMLYQRGRFEDVYFADCQGLVDKQEFIDFVGKMLKMLEEAYGAPVDIELAIHNPSKEIFQLNLLQCRPIQAGGTEKVAIPKGIDNQILFDVRRTSMRRSKTEPIDLVVWIDPQNYYEFPHMRKYEIAKKIGEINQYFENAGKKMMLLVPGRIGTSSPELGVPVIYADISQFVAICEVAYSKVGYRPELSYGSHMFQDLVEADVYYGAINENSKTRIYNPQILEKGTDLFGSVWTDDAELSPIIKIYDVEKLGGELLLDAKDGRAVCRLKNL